MYFSIEVLLKYSLCGGLHPFPEHPCQDTNDFQNQGCLRYSFCTTGPTICEKDEVCNFFLQSKKKTVILHSKRFTTMQAFILAAGLGTRLQPLTNHCPKALVEINGIPILRIQIENLIHQGVRYMVVNVHHLADMICNYIKSNNWDAEIVISDERERLLDTGGALKKAESLFNEKEPIIVHNVDILSRINLREMVSYHQTEGNMSTLAVCHRKTSRYLLFDNQKQLIGWRNQSSGEAKWVNGPTAEYTELAFSGISVVEPSLLRLLPPATQPYPIIPEYLSIAKYHRISYFLHTETNWIDVGTPQKLNMAQQWNLSSPK